jgi:hypothetical protein
MQTLHLNLILAWTWIWLGFLSGLGLGCFFHREDWLGGYAGFKRRLYRLAHIAFSALGVANLCFYFTALQVAHSGPGWVIASWGFIAGAISMPACCVLTAHFPRTRLLFGVPVLSLLLAGLITIVNLLPL